MISKLGVGPMSKDILSILYDYSERRGTQLMIIPSMNQVNSTGGYVEHWNTHQFMVEITRLDRKYPKANIKLCRDHLGPGFHSSGAGLQVATEFLIDLQLGFDLIHIDACHVPMDNQLPFTLLYANKCVDYGAAFEVGTDVNNGAPTFDRDKITRFLDEVCTVGVPEFFVHQTGSLIMEDKQVGAFNLELVHQVKETLKPYGVKLKEHNADYLTLGEVQLRRGLVDAMNIAPQLGVMQTEVFLELFNNHPETKDFITKCVSSRCWEKWALKPKEEYTSKELAKICGHYNFTTPEYSNLLGDKDTHTLMMGVLRARIFSLLDMYREGLDDVH